MCLRPLPQTQACNRQSWSSWACLGDAVASWRGQITRSVPLAEHDWAAAVAQEVLGLPSRGGVCSPHQRNHGALHQTAGAPVYER